MAEKVGFITNVKPEWMDIGFQCKAAGKSKEEAKPIIEEALSATYKSKENVLKTRRILETVFLEEPTWILDSCVNNFTSGNLCQHLPMYWALLTSTYPVFYDTCHAIGVLNNYRDTVSLLQAREQVYEKWGARNIIHQAVKKVFQTLKDFNVLEPTEHPGQFKVNRFTVDDPQNVIALVGSVLTASENSYMTWESVVSSPALFPFRIEHVTQADLAASEHLLLERMGDGVVIRIKSV